MFKWKKTTFPPVFPRQRKHLVVFHNFPSLLFSLYWLKLQISIKQLHTRAVMVTFLQISFRRSNFHVNLKLMSFCTGCCLQTAVQLVEVKEKQPSTKQRAKFDPMDWMDSVNEQPATPQPLRCFYGENFGLFFPPKLRHNNNLLTEQR